MYFNSTTFLWFIAAFLLLYFVVRHNISNRNRLIVAASYFFYGWWDWRFLGLLLLSSLVDFYVGKKLPEGGDQRRKQLVCLSLVINLGALCFFKYFDFFLGSVVDGLEMLGVTANLPMLQVILPVGISFYTFQSLSYTIDIYRGQMKPTRDLTAFLAYVSFFPQLVAGPIERAGRLLPQFAAERRVTAVGLETGVWLIVWGLFKKVVIADNLAPLVDMVYSDPTVAGPIIALGTIAFGFQIYCDFSGYSDIARGVASVLGFQLMVNFNLPYLSTSPRDFWRRWHISLSSWFRDYLYIPLGGNRKGVTRNKVNLLITMLLAGLWHGAGWNFILWGVWHGAMLALFGQFAPKKGWQSVFGWTLTMGVVFYGWMLFRAQSMGQIGAYTTNVWLPTVPTWFGSYLINLILFVTPLVLVQIWQRKTDDLMPSLRLGFLLRTLFHGLLLFMILIFWDAKGTPFIYFQF